MDMTSAEKRIEIDFRWSLPVRTNGEIRNYVVSHSTNSAQGPWGSEQRVRNSMSFDVTSAHENTVYYFRVKACTRGTCSEYTVPVSANTTGVTCIS